MSWTLTKRGLDLFDDDEVNPSSDSVESTEVSTHRHGIQRAVKQKERIQRKKKEIRNQLVQKQIIDAVKEYKKSRPTDETKKNLKLLKKLDGKIGTAYSENIIKYHDKNLVKRYPKTVRKDGPRRKKQKETSVFTDEDFARVTASAND